MIVDTSAVVAVAQHEPGWEKLRDILAANDAFMSSATYVELFAVMGRRDHVVVATVEEFLSRMDIRILPFTERQARIARVAYQRFGKGSGSPAKLNMGDCFSYALAADRQDKLLFVGQDFTYTDALPA